VASSAPSAGPDGPERNWPVHERLDSWKEIASYLRRGVRTVQRWEKDEGMPVHRHLHDRQDSIYAYGPELDAWWAGRRERLERQELSEGEPRASTAGSWRSRRNIWVLSVLVVALAASAYVWISNATRPTNSGVQVRSLAVLPFKPLVAAARDEYLELGMADALITRLSNLRQLVVRPTSAIVKYAGAGQDPLAAGRDLRVDAVLDGRIQRAGDRIRVTVQLIQVGDGRPLWAETFEQQWTHIFAMQNSISEKMTEALRFTLSGEEKKRLARRDTDSAEAYQLYLKGRYCWNKRTEEWLRKGIQFFQQAIEADPGYALAYVGLADSYTQLAIVDIGGLRPKEAFPQAKEAAARALSIDQTLAEAHATLGFAGLHYDWDWPGAEREVKRAIELNPNYATAHQWYGLFLSAMGRHDEAIREATRAHDLDPVSLAISRGVAFRPYEARRYDQAIESARKTLELEPSFAPVRYVLGLAYVQKASFERAIGELQQAVTLSGGNPTYIGALGFAYARAGRKGDARTVIADLEELSKRRYVPPYNIALIYTGLGENDRAFEWLQKAYEERSSRLVWLKVVPEVDSLRADPRFQDLLRRVGLSDR